ncbi:MAG: ATP-binding protein [Bacteroidota bacterium]
MGKKRIVITGGPGTGKTVVIQQLEKAGFHCFHEIIRTMTLEAKKKGDAKTFVSNPIVSVNNPAEFNNTILEGRIQQFKDAYKVKGAYAFYDRGIPDVLAYMDFFDQSYAKPFITACKEHVYDTIFLLPPWEEIYVSDNERLESFEEALEVHKHLESTYTRFGYDITLVPKTTIEERFLFILKKLNIQ